MISTPDGGPGDIVSPGPIVMYEHAGRWSAATSVGLLFYGVSRADAENQLAEAGITSPLVSCDGLTWQATWQSALSHELLSIDERLETLPQTEDVERIKSRQEVISENLAALSASVAAERSRRAEVAELQSALRLMFPTIKAALPGKPTDEEVMQVVNATYHARRLREIQ